MHFICMVSAREIEGREVCVLGGGGPVQMNFSLLAVGLLRGSIRTHHPLPLSPHFLAPTQLFQH